MVGLELWEQIDHPIWVADEEAEDPNDRVDGVERFFNYLINSESVLAYDQLPVNR